MQERLNTVWRSMKLRCENPIATGYKNYGGRGIKVCEEWQNYEAFKKWALENGYDEKAPRGECTIDRINIDGNYEPTNCRFANTKEQARNRTGTKYIEIDGVRKSLMTWAEEYDIPAQILRKRYYGNGIRGKDLLRPCKVAYGEEIKNIRTLRGDVPLTKMARESHIARSTLFELERGRYIPGYSTSEKLSKYFKLPIGLFLCHIEEERA